MSSALELMTLKLTAWSWKESTLWIEYVLFVEPKSKPFPSIPHRASAVHLCYLLNIWDFSFYSSVSIVLIFFPATKIILLIF